MPKKKEPLHERLVCALIAAVVAGLGALVVQYLDYAIWGFSWFQADTFDEYLRTAWYIPTAVAVIAGLYGFFKGVDAFDFARSFWSDGRWTWRRRRR